MKASRFIAYGLLLACIAATVWLVFNRQYVADQLVVWQFKPSLQASALKDSARMSDQGEFYYYASQPVVEGTQIFNQQCKRAEPQSAILGCYADGRIFIYDVTNEQLKGVKAVTAAHEMLHAVFERLDEGEKARIAQLLEAQYKKLNESELNSRMEYYARVEPGERTNELHSIIATEFTDISPELETYYKRYFTDRKAVVGFHASYKAVFDGLQEKGDELAQQMTGLAAEIEVLSDKYNDDISALNADIGAFNAKAKNGDFNSQSEFNAARAVLIARTSQLTTNRDAISAKVTLYNQLRTQLLEINSQSEALNKSIDSTLAPPPAL